MKSFLGGFLGISTMFFMALPPAHAAGPKIFPLACLAGQSCWITGYPDLDGDEGSAKDFMCGPAAEDGLTVWQEQAHHTPWA